MLKTWAVQEAKVAIIPIPHCRLDPKVFPSVLAKIR